MREDHLPLIKAYLQATVAIYGSILFWVGAWDLLTESKYRPAFAQAHATESYSFLPWSLKRTVLYTWFGMAGCVVMDTLYTTAGMQGYWLPRTAHRVPWMLWMRALVGIVAMVFLWVGMYDFLAYSCINDDLARDAVLIIAGLLLLHGTATFYNFAYVYPADAPITLFPTASSTFAHHAVHALRAVISLVAQNMIWVGAYDMSINFFELNASYNVLEDEIFLHPDRNSVVYREARAWTTLSTREHIIYNLLLTTMGVLLLVVTRSYIANSWIVTDYEEDDGEETLSFCFNIRAHLALVGQLLNNTGTWMLIDVYLWPNSLMRNIVYTIVGALLLVATSTFFVNASVAIADDDEGESSPDIAPWWRLCQRGGRGSSTRRSSSGSDDRALLPMHQSEPP